MFYPRICNSHFQSVCEIDLFNVQTNFKKMKTENPKGKHTDRQTDRQIDRQANR